MTATLASPALDLLRDTPSRSRGGQTLEDRLEQAWEGLGADGTAACPVCHGRMERRGGVGRCDGCGSTLD